MKEISIREWIQKFNSGCFGSNDRKTQIKAGWYDWFCRDYYLRAKTYKMGKIINQIKDGGKIDLDNWYVWFKNNCPICFQLYDDFRFADRKTYEVQFTIEVDCKSENFKYVVYGIKNDFEEPLFKTNSVKDLVKWFNEKW